MARAVWGFLDAALDAKDTNPAAVIGPLNG
jgi:hypothetical protein